MNISALKFQPFKIAKWLLLAVIGLSYFFPFLWMTVTSLKTFAETLVFPPSFIPERFMFENYLYVWQSGPFTRYFFNSFLISSVIVIVQFAITIPAAFAFSVKSFRGSKIIYAIIIFGLMIPVQVVVIPIYLLLSQFGLINTYAALILPFIVSPFAIFLLTESFKQIPKEMIEAAKLDRSPDWKILMFVMVPMAKQTIVTIALLVFIYHWNDLFWVLVMTNNEMLHTLPVGIMNISNSEEMQWQLLMAGNIIMIAPLLLLYLAANKRIKSGFTYSGIK